MPVRPIPEIRAPGTVKGMVACEELPTLATSLRIPAELIVPGSVQIDLTLLTLVGRFIHIDFSIYVRSQIGKMEIPPLSLGDGGQQ
jgi:hypothetical protein